MQEQFEAPFEVGFTGAVQLDIPADLQPVYFNGIDITARLWELAGAFDGSCIQVRRATVGTEFGSVTALKLKVKHPRLLARPMQRWIYSVDDGASIIDIIENVEFYLREEFQGQGIGRASLLTEAIAANELQFDKILAIAAGSPSDARHLGWKIWPRLGYDATIPQDILQRMPYDRLALYNLDHRQTVRISQLIECDIFDLWETYGEGCIMELDVSSLESWSMKQLASVAEE